MHRDSGEGVNLVTSIGAIEISGERERERKREREREMEIPTAG